MNPNSRETLYERVTKARTVLGLGEEATLDEIKKTGSSEESVGALTLQCRGNILQISDLLMVQAYSKPYASLSPYPSRDCSTPSPWIGGRLGWGCDSGMTTHTFPGIPRKRFRNLSGSGILIRPGETANYTTRNHAPLLKPIKR